MTIRFLFIIIFTLIISVIDAKTLKIPDFLLLFFFIVLVIIDIQISSGIWFLLERFIAVLFWASIFFLIYNYSGGLGFGDVKYAALLGYALGFEKSLVAFICTALSAILLYSIGIGVFRWTKTAKLPFAPFLSFGALAAEVINFSI